MEKLLQLAGATVKFRQQVLFENLNFEINKNEHWAIVGESGSGKSAFLQALAGKLHIAGGQVRNHFYDEFIQNNKVDDPFFTYHDLIGLVDIKHDFRNLSHTRDFYYQQRYNAWDSDDAPTVEDYLQEKSRRAVLPGTWTIPLVFEKFDLEKLRHKQLIKLSNGEAKRLRIAAALLKNPALLLLDNPLAGLDANMRDKFNSLFKEIAVSGISMVMVTQSTEIPEIITHIGVLQREKPIVTIPRNAFDPLTLAPKPFQLPDSGGIKAIWTRENELRFDVLVKMENVSVRYGETSILRNINWEIKPGERWALSGPNGSGKSTLLSLINGDNPQAYANDITLFDQKRGTGESIWDIKRKIGFMSPELYQYFPGDYTCLHVAESGFSNTLGLFRNEGKENETAALQWLELMEIAALRDRKLQDVSASQQRLCLLARALVNKPYLLILDEPCQGMDQRQQDHFRSLIDIVCEESDLSLIYVTHYQEELPESITHRLALPYII